MKRIKAKNRRIVKEKTLLVAVDIGKITNVGYYRYPDGSDGRAFVFHNHYQGLTKFWDMICKAKAAKHMEEVVVGFESTGAYGEPLMHFLRAREVTLVQVNPMHVKRLKELQGNSPNKTDEKDPKVIADVIALGHALTVVIPEGTAAELRRLTQARERSLQRRTALLNQLQELVFVIFPEFLQVMRDMKTKSARYLLMHHPTPQDIVTLGIEPLAAALKRVSRGILGRARAGRLYEAAQLSVGIQEGRSSIVLEIREILCAIENSELFITQAQRDIGRRLRQIPYSHLILSMKGIGVITLGGIIGEVGDFTKFHSISELVKHAGLDLYEISSGKHKGQRHISKRGRALLRKLLFFAALCTVRKGGIMHEHYQRYLANGMKKIMALVAVARKLLGIMFALVRDQSTYKANYPEAQRARKAA